MRGPGRYKKTLKRSKTLRNLRPGIYRIIAKPTKSKKFKATASVRTQRIRVTASGARALVNYDSIVSRKLTRLPSSGIRAFAPPALGGVGTLRTNKNFARGDIIAGGVSPKAPHGLLVRVVSKSGQTYRVQQVPLDQAIPRGRFAVRFNTNLAPAARALRHGRVGARAIQKMPVKCQAAVAAGIEVGASGGISTNISADWDWADSSIRMTSVASASANMHAYLKAAGSCKLTETLLYRHTFAPITVTVGPIPVVIVPDLGMFTGGSVSANGAVEVNGNVGVQATLKAFANRNGLATDFIGPKFTKSASFKSTASVSGNVYIKGVLTGKLYGLAGPHATVKLNMQANADKDANPWWKVDAVGSAGVGVAINACVKVLFKNACINFDKHKDDLFSKRVRIIDSGGPLGTPNPGSEIAGDVAGPGVAITSPDSGGTAGTGRVPSFDGQGDAWVLSTGLIAQVTGTDSSFFASSDRGEPGNATLSSLAGEETQDATFVNMTVTPSGNRLRIDYMFGSEEYPEYVGSSYNDVMGVFVNGQNCATVPGTSARSR